MKGGYQVQQLGDVVELVMGQAPPGKDSNFEGIGTPFVKVGEFGELRPLIRQWTTNPKKLARATDVLLCVVGATCGKVNLGADCAIGRSVAAIRPNSGRLDQLYLYYFLNTLIQKLREESVGAAQTVISKDMIRAVSIPLPPLEEQKRIVAILDDAFEGIDRAKQNAEKNLTNAKELFESYLNRVFTEKGERWTHCTLFEHVKFIDYRGKTPPKTEAGVRLITAKNVKMGYLNREPQEFIDPSAYDEWMTRGFPEEGDVLFSTEAPLANVTQLDTTETVVVGQRLITMQPAKNVLTSRFLKYCLMSQPIQNEIHSRATGATVLGIKARLLKEIPIFFPKSLKVQDAISEKLDDAWSLTGELQGVGRAKTAALVEFKQSILQKAFAGDLT